MKKIVFVLLISIVWSACEEAKSCQHGDPTPMFSNELEGVVHHDFQKKNQQSVEMVSFDSGVDLEVLQEGCENLKQEFRFTVKGNRENVPDSLWMKEASRQFAYIATLSAKLMPMKQWGDAIEQVRGQMKLGEPAALSENIHLTIDRINGRGESTLLVVLESK